MPGPGQRHKGKGKTKAKGGGGAVNASQNTSQTQAVEAPKVVPCMTLDEDEIMRCDNPATEGYPRPERCKMHHTQYVDMYKKYKDASKVVDEIAKGGKFPTKEQIAQYTDVSVILEKARYVKRYIEAIRVERTGRDIHSRRFFLKVDDGHKIRLKVLAKEMIRGVDALDGLQTRAFKLHIEKNPRPDWADAGIPPSVEDRLSMIQLLSAEAVVTKSLEYGVGLSRGTGFKAITANIPASSGTDNEQDLIDLEIRRQKDGIIRAFDVILDPDKLITGMTNETGQDPNDPQLRRTSINVVKTMQQYALRIIFYDPVLFAKAEGKVSMKDLIMSDDFSMNDMVRFRMLLEEKLGFGLLWMKDSLVEALTISSAGLSNVANVGDPKNRIKILDGWIYNVTHTKTTSNEAWFQLFDVLAPIPANIENRFVRLCNSYDDLISVLSFGALGSYPSPSFCRSAPVYRNHLSLSGVVITDMISAPKPAEVAMAPTRLPARKPGHRTWVEFETRAYLFGAIRYEPDKFTEAFLHELKSRPDLFQVIIRSETDPGQELEVYGPSKADNPIPNIRARHFEVPREVVRPVEGHGEWKSFRSAKDILYGTDPKILGYLTILGHGVARGWFFRFKKFKVRYIVIMDAIPNRHHDILAEQVAWAALRAHGYAKGDYSERKYATASDDLFDKCAKERLGWLPAGSWGTTKMG